MIWVVDFGSQYTGLILRRLRQMGVKAIWKPFREPTPLDSGVRGIILSGGPQSVWNDPVGLGWLQSAWGRVPILGICYGLQLLAAFRGWPVERAPQGGEFGATRIRWTAPNPFFPVGFEHTVWMSHNDVVQVLHEGVEAQVVSLSQAGYVAAVIWPEKAWGVQFHPEVGHSQEGEQIFKAFLNWCGVQPDENRNYVWDLIDQSLSQVPDRQTPILMALSGGVDSVVALRVLHHWGFGHVVPVMVDTGLLRAAEVDWVSQVVASWGYSLEVIPAADRFLKALEGVALPEVKRKIIGQVFIQVFDQWVQSQKMTFPYLAQGTLYSDVIESHHPQKASDVTIKTHHNVGGLPSHLPFQLIEPLRMLFKDEVRWLGRQLGVPDRVIERQPFPGPGLAVRIMGPVTPQKVELLRQVESVVEEFWRQNPLTERVWQIFPILGSDFTTGVRGDRSHYGPYVALRMVQSQDAMTANVVWPPPQWLEALVQAILSRVPDISRVVFDVTQKPPATIEWQ